MNHFTSEEEKDVFLSAIWKQQARPKIVYMASLYICGYNTIEIILKWRDVIKTNAIRKMVWFMKTGKPSDSIFPFLMAGRREVKKWLPGLSAHKGNFSWECLTTEIQANKTGFNPYLSDCIFCLAWLWWFTLQSCLRLNSYLLSSPTRCSASSESYLYHSFDPRLDQEN